MRKKDFGVRSCLRSVVSLEEAKSLSAYYSLMDCIHVSSPCSNGLRWCLSNLVDGRKDFRGDRFGMDAIDKIDVKPGHGRCKDQTVAVIGALWETDGEYPLELCQMVSYE